MTLTGKEALLYRPIEGTNKVVCTACARYCKVAPGQIGLCGIRGNEAGKLWLYVYGKVIAGHIDPIEKKPVTHYRPGSKIFSIATTGCNWLCHPAGTEILLQDGTTKAVEEIAPGDVLWSYDLGGNLSPRPSVVTHVGTRQAQAWELICGRGGDSLRLTEEHPVLTRAGWREARELRPGDEVLRVWPARRPGVPTDLRGLEAGDVARLLAGPPMANRRSWVPVGEVGPAGGPVRVYSFECVPHHNYVADGVVVHNCQYCFLPGTVVLTDMGHERIESLFARGQESGNPEVRLGDGAMALTHRGRWRRVVKAFEHLYAGPILRVKPHHLPEFRCTPDHRIFASIAGGPVGKVPARRLKLGDFVAVPRPRASGDGPIDGEAFLRSRPAPPSNLHRHAGARGGRARGTSEEGDGVPDGLPRMPGLARPLGHEPRVHPAGGGPERDIGGRRVSRAGDHAPGLLVEEAVLDPRAAPWRASRVRVVETPDYLLVPIEGLGEEEYVGPVYNLEVEEDHSYTANFAAVANCQNYDISQRRKVEGLDATPEEVVNMALRYRSDGIAYTYNQPTIFIEYAHDIGVIAREHGLINIFVSNGYDTPETVAMMKDFLDCITVDFKGSGEEKFVRKYIGIPNAQPIYDTLQELHDKTDIHVEITDLIVPQVGDNLEEARKLCKFVHDLFGPDIPIHFLRWHPDYKMMDLPLTPVETLERHCQVAKEVGLRYVYIGNVPGHPLEHTYCPGCGRIAIKRFGFDITGWNLDKDNRCRACGYQLPIVGQLAESVRENRFRPVIW